MTAQINDKFIYKKRSYNISAIKDPETFFVIHNLGLEPEAKSTACWRGYVAEFAVSENQLVLKNLSTNNGNGKSPIPTINGTEPLIVKPEGLVPEYSKWLELLYKNVNLELHYSGAALLTDKFISDRYIHMGFQSPLSYEVVIELTFENGILQEKKDLSSVVAAKRNNMTPEDRHSQLERLPLWIEECFDLSYKTKWI
jgi:hypothetical protein